MVRTLAICLFDDVEVLDFAGPFEVFSVAGLRTLPEPPFKVFTVSEQSPVIARSGLTIIPTYTFANTPTPDIVLIPGGGGYKADGTPFGTRKEVQNPVMIDWIRRNAASAELVLSVCTGALILAKAGLLDGLQATTHFKAIETLREIAPTTTVVDGVRYVDNGRIITSAGVSAGIDMSYHVVHRLLGAEVALEGAQYAQYDYWQP